MRRALRGPQRAPQGHHVRAVLSTEEPQRHTPAPPEGAPQYVAGATVLVVEDDDAVRALLCRVLRAAGYRVLEAANGGEALLLAEQREGGLELLLCELVLPRSSGRLVARRIAALAPGLRVLFLSGSELDAAAFPDAEGGNALLRKPFTPTELLCAVAAQLRAPR